MSRPIAESLSLLSETLGNCKTNLAEKQVADVENIKISDVDEKIAEIQAGGGDLDLSKPITFNIEPTTFTAPSTTFTVSVTPEQIEKYHSGKKELEIRCFYHGIYKHNSVKNQSHRIVLKETDNYQKNIIITTDHSTDNLANIDNSLCFAVYLDGGDDYDNYGESFTPSLKWKYEG